jgi:hypothetical protein
MSYIGVTLYSGTNQKNASIIQAGCLDEYAFQSASHKIFSAFRGNALNYD